MKDGGILGACTRKSYDLHACACVGCLAAVISLRKSASGKFACTNVRIPLGLPRRTRKLNPTIQIAREHVTPMAGNCVWLRLDQKHDWSLS